MKVVYEDRESRGLSMCTMHIYSLVVEVDENVYLASIVSRYSNSGIMEQVSKVFFGMDEAIHFVQSRTNIHGGIKE